MTNPETVATPLWAIGLTVFCSVLGALGQAFFKAGSKTLSLKPLELVTNWPLLTGLGFYGAATVLFVFALKNGRLSTLYPFIALSYIWVFFISLTYFKEFEGRSVTLNLAGVAVIFAGVILVALGR